MPNSPIFNESSNELFRFVHLRRAVANNVEPVDGNPDEDNVISQLYPFIVNNLKTPLSKALEKHKGLDNALSSIQKEVLQFKKKDSYIDGEDTLKEKTPTLSLFSEWLYDNKRNLTVKGAISYLKSIQKKSKDKSPQISKDVLWDNLYVYLFTGENVLMLLRLSKTIKVVGIVETLNQKGSIISDEGLRKLISSKVLIPEWMYNVLNGKDKKADEGIGVEQIGRPSKKQRQEENMKMIELLVGASIFLQEVKDLREEGGESNELLTKQEFKKIPLEFTKILEGYETKPIAKLEKEVLEKAKKIAINLNKDKEERYVQIGSTIIRIDDLCADMAVKTDCGTRKRETFFPLFTNYASSAYIGDLLVTKQYLKKYNLGEVAHIEAVLKGLEKERTHRRLNITETTSFFETESINETERETQTTERFGMEKESFNVINKDLQINAGVSVSANYGLTNIQASAGFSYGYSQENAVSEATSFSKEITNRALSKVKQRIRETQTVTIINEVEETSIHKILNAGDNANHINGVYRWVDKTYLNKILSYGPRLMLEFTIPEPANFYLFRRMLQPETSGNVVLKPTPPSLFIVPSTCNSSLILESFHNICEDNYAEYAAYYKVSDIAPPPPKEQYVGITKTQQFSDKHDRAFEESSLIVPENYVAKKYRLRADFYQGSSSYGMIAFVGTNKETTTNFPFDSALTTVDSYYSGASIPFTVKLWGPDPSSTVESVYTLNILCERTEEAFKQWQIETYNAILQGYQARLAEYNEWNNTRGILGLGVNIEGNNPEINRKIEREELKKRCIELMSAQRFESFDAATNGLLNVSGFPEILFEEAKQEGKIVKYFEQVYDWANMTYIFYPYFYGKKNNWLTITSLADNDPLFTKFLQAGYARAVVPVRKGMEDYAGSLCGMLTWLLDTDPSDIVGVEADWYISVAQELMEAEGISFESPDFVNSYEQKVPTNLVYIVPEGHVEGTPWPGLPDNSNDPNISDPSDLSNEHF